MIPNISIIKTAVLRIENTNNYYTVLEETSKEYNKILNLFSELNKDRLSNSVKLHHLLYYTIRNQSPLPSCFINTAKRKVASVYKSIVKRQINLKRLIKKFPDNYQLLKQYNKICLVVPKFTSSSIELGNQTYKINKNNKIIQLSTINGRLTFQYKICSHYESILNSAIKFGGLHICKHKNNKWYAHIAILLQNKQVSIKDPISPLGIDLGIRHLAVLSNKEIINENTIKQKRLKYQKLISSLQSNDSRNAKRKLRKISGKMRRYTKQINHVISKHIVQIAIDNHYSSIVMEQLTHIKNTIRYKKSQNDIYHKWSFAEIQKFIKYKCEYADKLFFLVDPKYTSQNCHVCGTKGKRNRDKFICTTCGKTFHADINAAINIADLGIQCEMSYRTFYGLPVQLA
nr:MAG TPA: endonuclease [Caudoviricetes sp.]